MPRTSISKPRRPDHPELHGIAPGPDGETADGMSLGKIERIIDALRHERYRFKPVRRVYIPKKNGKKRPLGLPSWSDKLVGEVIRLLLEAYYEPQFSDRSHGYRPKRGCHTALSEVANWWTGTTWFIVAVQLVPLPLVRGLMRP
jgi:retron-type reverse transcriptase